MFDGLHSPPEREGLPEHSRRPEMISWTAMPSLAPEKESFILLVQALLLWEYGTREAGAHIPVRRRGCMPAPEAHIPACETFCSREPGGTPREPQAGSQGMDTLCLESWFCLCLNMDLVSSTSTSSNKEMGWPHLIQQL